MRINRPVLVFVCVSLFFFAFVERSSGAVGLNSFVFPQFWLDSLPGGYFFPSFFENIAPDTTFLIEENNGFSLIDSPRVYYEGDSFVNFNWFFNDFSINSILEDGAPSILLPFSAVNQYELQGESPLSKDYGFHFLSEAPKKSFFRVHISNVWSNLGGYIPGATTMVNPHATSSGRDLMLYSERRKISANSFADFIYSRTFERSALSFSMTYFEIQRLFNDFNTFDSQFEEKGKLFLAQTTYEKKFKGGFFRMDGVFNDLSRDHLFAELGRFPQETGQKDKQSVFAGITVKKRNFNLNLSFQHEKHKLLPTQGNFLKDLRDNDGDGFYPYERWGEFTGDVFRLNADCPVTLFTESKNSKTQMTFFADLKMAALKGKESIFDFDPISFDGSPELVILWQNGSSYRNTNDSVRAGTIFTQNFGSSLSFYAKFLVQHSSLRFRSSQNDLSAFNIGYDVGVLLFQNRNPEILLSFGQTPYELRENLNFFLEKDRPGGAFYTWHDSNSDLQYQGGEEGQFFGTTGAPFHHLDEDIRVPTKKRFLASLSTRLSRQFRLNIKGLFKRISNSFWVEFKEDYGFFETDGSSTFFYFNQPFKEYVLSNVEFDKNPFYAQLLLQVVGSEEKKWFFSFSFMAHIGMGYTAFGNGPAASDIGVVDESQANPNAWINGYGRVDGDRAFVAKIVFGFSLSKNLFVAANLKYRDGDPFAFIETRQAHGQRIFYLQTIRAENWKGIKGGPREDYVSDVSIKMRYSFRLFGNEAELYFSLFNLFDFGSELSEYVFSGGWRYANELQIPRSLRAGLLIWF